MEIDGERRAFGGQIITFDSAAELSFSNNWESDGWSVPTLITIRLTALYNACRVGLSHHGFERLGADAARNSRATRLAGTRTTSTPSKQS